MTETEIQWQPSDMVEVVLNEPDDFLKVRETLLVSVLHLDVIENYISHVTFFINKANITSFTSKSCLLWMAKH